MNYISASEVYISDDRYIHRERGFVGGEVLTNEFEMVENVFEATLTLARARTRRQMDIPRFRNIFAMSICDIYVSLYRYNECRTRIESFIRDPVRKPPRG